MAEGAVVLFTGLSGSGKSTLAGLVKKELAKLNYNSVILDGDFVRKGLCADLGFSANDRSENIRRVGHVAKLFSDAGFVVLIALIAPFKADRTQLRKLFKNKKFVEVYCNCDLGTCELRDVKGLYKKARLGAIPDFTGISSIYEEPSDAKIVLDTGKKEAVECTNQVITYLQLYKHL